jgi:hypothetical protein
MCHICVSIRLCMRKTCNNKCSQLWVSKDTALFSVFNSFYYIFLTKYWIFFWSFIWQSSQCIKSTHFILWYVCIWIAPCFFKRGFSHPIIYSIYFHIGSIGLNITFILFMSYFKCTITTPEVFRCSYDRTLWL